jgi:hypothetical protein
MQPSPSGFRSRFPFALSPFSFRMMTAVLLRLSEGGTACRFV